MRLLPAVLAFSMACANAAAPQRPEAPAFDGERAFAHLKRLVDIGPRVAGSPGAAAARAYIIKELAALGIKAEEQPFTAATPSGPVRMANVRAVLPGGDGARVIFAGHYDTKLFKDVRFVGANDGGSSAAFLIELARVLKGRRNAAPIELLFFDGEEAIVEWSLDSDSTYGSRHYVEAARKDGTLAAIRALILVDMIGDRELQIKRDLNSTPWLNDIVWAAAKSLGQAEFAEAETQVEDDHIPFVRAGVPSIDIIDLEYPNGSNPPGYWHTAEDTLDKVAPRSLQVVGDVLLKALDDIEKRPRL